MSATAKQATDVFARWSSGWREEQRKAQQKRRRRAKMKRWKLDAEEQASRQSRTPSLPHCLPACLRAFSHAETRGTNVVGVVCRQHRRHRHRRRWFDCVVHQRHYGRAEQAALPTQPPTATTTTTTKINTDRRKQRPPVKRRPSVWRLRRRSGQRSWRSNARRRSAGTPTVARGPNSSSTSLETRSRCGNCRQASPAILDAGACVRAC